jgi:hypothetical protein
MQEELFEKCLIKANSLLLNGQNFELDLFQLTELLYKIELEKYEKDALSDLKLDYNDEIVSIEEVGEKETIDISVTGDNLFYCNDILTKNSFGLPMTVDLLFAVMRTEELDQMGQLLIKQLKSRYNDINYYKRFVVGVDIMKFKLYDADNPTSDLNGIGRTDDDTPVFDKGSFGKAMASRGDVQPLDFD